MNKEENNGHVLRPTPETLGGHGLFDHRGLPIKKANKFLDALAARGLSPRTIRSYGYDLVILYRWLHENHKKFAHFTEVDLQSWIMEHRSKMASPQTINRRLVTCYIFYRYCFNRDIPSAPGVSRPSRYYQTHIVDHRLGIVRLRKGHRFQLRVKSEHRLVEPLKIEEVNAYLELISRYRDLAMVLLMLLCGLRSREVLLLRMKDVCFKENWIRVSGKGNRERALPLPAPIIEAVKKYLHLERPQHCPCDRLFVVLQGTRRGKEMTAAGLRSLFRSRRAHPISSRANPHRFRHTFGADMARSGVKLPVLQRMMGHASGLTTLRYIQLSTADIAQEYQRALERIGQRYGQNLKV